MKNLKKHLTLSALFAAGTMLSYTAHAEDINVSNISKLIEAIAKSGTNTANLQNDISATTPTTSFGCLGELKGTLTINGGTSKYGISGSYGTDSHYDGITVGSEKMLSINNVGSVDDNGNIIKSWNGFAYITSSSSAVGGAIYNNNKGTVKIGNSVFSNNFAYASNFAKAEGGAIDNRGEVTIDNSTFSNNFASASSSVAMGGAIANYETLKIENSTFSNNFASSETNANGGAIFNASSNSSNPVLTITDSSFSGNYAKVAATSTNNAAGGAIFNSGIANIIASTKDSVFSENYTQVGEEKTRNDIYNYKSERSESSGIINLYAASEKKISFKGGIVGSENSIVNVNVQGTTTYDVAGTVLFKNGSVNSGNNFTLGAGTLKLESGVSWTNNSLTQTGGTLDLANGVIEETAFTTLESTGGTVILDINFTAGTADQIMVVTEAQIANGTLTNAIKIGSLKI